MRRLAGLALARPGVVALALILLVTGLLWQRQKIQKLNVFDQPFYLGIAYDLVHHGRFSDGYMFADPGPDAVRPPGMRFAPLWPGLVAGAAVLDPGLRAGMDCVVASAGRDDGCPAAAPSLRLLQFAELAGFFWLVWWMGGQAGGITVGWLSLGLALVATPLLLRSVGFLMTEMTCLFLAAAATAAGVRALGVAGRARLRTAAVGRFGAAPAAHPGTAGRAGLRTAAVGRLGTAPAAHPETAGRARLGWACASGVLLGLTALTRPAFLYLVPVALVALALAGRRRALLPGAAFLAGAVAALAPWIIRNAAVLGRPALTYGYDSHTLVQRIAFDTMSWREYAHAYLCWLPDGTALGRDFLGPHGCDRFAWDDQPSSFYVLGLRHMLPETLAAAGGYDHHLGYLLTHYILRMPVWHVLVSIPLALRGAYVEHWWGFILLPVALVWTVLALRCRWRGGQGDRGAAVFLVLALPAWFMLALNAGVAVNQVRYNLLLIAPYAVAGGLSLRTLWARAGLSWRVLPAGVTAS